MGIDWQARMGRWLDNRIPKARQFSLGHKSIFIFPSKFGWLYLTLCLGIFILGTNYQNNLMQLLCFFLIALFLLNLFVAYLNFSKLSIQLGKTHHVYAGEQVQLPLWINHEEQAELIVGQEDGDEVTRANMDTFPENVFEFPRRGEQVEEGH